MLLCLVLFLALSGCGAGDDKGDYVDAANASFNIWCGDKPCAWEVEDGEVKQVPTWHEKHQGIALIGNPSRISQVVPFRAKSCIVLSMLSDLDEGVTLHWKVDFNNDGFEEGVDTSVKVGDGNWKTLYRETPVPDGAENARFIFEKTGKGRATISEASFFGDNYCAPNPSPTAVIKDVN